VLTLAGLSGKIQQVFSLCRRDAWRDPSPNSGWSECAFAAILEVQLGGKNFYKGVLKEKPLLGDPVQPITTASIEQALQLMSNCCLLGEAIAIFSLLCIAVFT
jgi:adenosylcobinamide-phosphate synthase